MAVTLASLRPLPDCPRCHGAGWLCEAHPELAMNHDEALCGAPGIPCEEPGCVHDQLERRRRTNGR